TGVQTCALPIYEQRIPGLHAQLGVTTSEGAFPLPLLGKVLAEPALEAAKFLRSLPFSSRTGIVVFSREVAIVKVGIHPEYVETTITCACGEVVRTRS